MFGDRQRLRHLDERWDAAVTPDESTGSPPAEATTIIWFQSLPMPAVPDPARERARRRLQEQIGRERQRIGQRPEKGMSLNGSVTAHGTGTYALPWRGHGIGTHGNHRRTRRQLSTALSYLLTAAMIAVTIALIVTFSNQQRQRAALPAVQTTPTTDAAPVGWTTMRGNPGRTNATDEPAPTGALHPRWTFNAGSAVLFPVWAGDAVYIATQLGMVYALDGATGGQRWSFDLGSTAPESIRFGSPTIGNGLVYVAGADGIIHALDAATGTERWSFPMGAVSIGTPALVEGVLYDSDSAGDVFALDAATGELRWQSNVGASICCSMPSVAGGLLIQGSDDGTLTVIRADCGYCDSVARFSR